MKFQRYGFVVLTCFLYLSVDAIRIGKRHLSIAVRENERLWPGGVVCFSVKSKNEFTSKQIDYLMQAMVQFEVNTNVRFLYVNDCKSNNLNQYCNNCQSFINLRHVGNSTTTCASVTNNVVGLNKTRTTHDLNWADRCFEEHNTEPVQNQYGVSIHVIGHALGLYHEHLHPNRTIGIIWDEIKQSDWSSYNTLEDARIITEYDPESIMHYWASGNGFCMSRFCAEGSTKNTESCVLRGTRFCGPKEDEIGCTKMKRSYCDEAASNKLGRRLSLSKLDIKSLLLMYPSPAWPLTRSSVTAYFINLKKAEPVVNTLRRCDIK